MERRKKELKEQYRQMKPEMGVFVLRNRRTGQCLLEASTDIPSMLNRIRFQLKMGMYPNRALQQDWKALGEAEFEAEIIDRLAYAKDESKTDYREDVKILKQVWLEKLQTEGSMLFYA